MRRILEPAATAMAATRISERQLAVLGAQLDALDGSSPVEEPVACDLEFHQSVVRSSGNSVLRSPLDRLSGPTTRARIRRGPAQKDAVGRTPREHRATLGALRDRDAEAARSWATVLITGVERWPRSALRFGGDLRVFDHGERGSHPFTPPCKGAASAPATRRKVGGSGEDTSEGGAG